MFQKLAVIEKNILRKKSTVYQSLNKVAIFPKMKVTLDLAEEALKVLVYYRKTSFAQTFFVKIGGVRVYCCNCIKTIQHNSNEGGVGVICTIS